LNLFMLTAPYQILNALEAIHHFGFADNHLRIIETGHFTREQFENIIDPAMWQSVRFYDFSYKLVNRNFGKNRPRNLWERLLEYYLVVDQMKKKWRANRIANGVGQLENLILGNYQRHYDMHMRHFSNRLRFRELYLLDVGTDTLRINRDRHAETGFAAEITVEMATEGRRPAFKQRIRRYFADWDTRGVDSLTFFTTYDLEPSGRDRVVRNDYAYLKSMVVGAKPSDKVFFAGQPLVDQCYLSCESFRTCMARIRDYFSGQRLIYVQHPRESELQLSVIRRLGIEIQRFTAPFEYVVAFSAERPRCIASFFSSVVENIASIFKETLAIQTFYLPEALLLKDWEEVARVYAQFRENKRSNIDVLDILELTSKFENRTD
jgi:hypothetical protein